MSRELGRTDVHLAIDRKPQVARRAELIYALHLIKIGEEENGD